MKAIIFDCDGTLVDSEMTHFRAWNHALEKQGSSFTLNDYYEYVGVTSDKTSQLLAKKIGKNCADELYRDKHAFFKSQIQDTIPPIQETLTFLQKLINEQHHWKYKLAIASGAPRYEILTYLRHLKIEHAFDVILSGKDDLNHYNDPEGTNKPKPYVYLEAAKQLGLDPSDCIAIEDSHPGVLASARAGCVTIAIPTPFSLNHDFSACDIFVSSLRDYSVEHFLMQALNSKRMKKTPLTE